MNPEYKEKIIMFAFYPKRRNVPAPQLLWNIHFYACLFDLAERGILKAEDNRLWCTENETGDLVLDSLISLLVPLSGKKLSRLQLLTIQKARYFYKMQLNQMTENHLLLKEDIVIISWRIGSRYRVRKYDLLNPDITKMERTFVYGRKPDSGTWRLALLAGEAKLFSNIFNSTEFRKKAEQRLREFLVSDVHAGNTTILELHKSLTKSLRNQKMVSAVAKA